MTFFAQRVDLRHHARAIHARRRGVDRNFRFHSLRPNFLPNFPHFRPVDFAHRELVKSFNSHAHRLDFVRRLNFFVALVVDILRRRVRRGIRLHKLFFHRRRSHQFIVHRLDPLGGNRLCDWSSDAFHGFFKRLLLGHAVSDVSSVQRLDDAVHAAQQNTSLAKDI